MTTLEIIFNNKVLGCRMCVCYALSLLALIIPLILWFKVKEKKKNKEAVVYMWCSGCPNKIQFPKNEIFVCDISFS